MEDFHECIIITAEEAAQESYRQALLKIHFYHFKVVVLEDHPELLP